MFCKLVGAAAATACVAGVSVLMGQPDNTLPEKPPQFRGAFQPTTTDTPPIPARRTPDRAPRLTDPATDETGRDVAEREIRGNETPPTPVLRRRNPDVVMATWIALGNQEEIALAEIAAQDAHSPEVKAFAEAMIEDHRAYLVRLKAFTPAAGQSEYLNTAAKDARKADAAPSTPLRADVTGGAAAADPEAGERARVGERLGSRQGIIPNERAGEATGVAANNRDFNVIQVERELAVQSLASTKLLLSEKSGPEFDLCFLSQQLAMHKAMRDQLIVYQRHVSKDLALVLAEGEQAVDGHLAKVAKLMRPFADRAVAAETRPTAARPASRVAQEK